MSSRIFSASIQGIDARLIEVEIDSSPGLHSFNIVGLPDKAVEESKDRIASAIKNSGFFAPSSRNKRIIVNLAPADIKKEGPSYDLPIAIGYLFESGQLKFNPDKRLFTGELSLDGSLRHTSGVLASTILAKQLGFDEVILPQINAQEASVVEGIKVIGAKNIADVINHLNGMRIILPNQATLNILPVNTDDHPLLHIKGQESAKRALIIAAAGAHNILMNGAPGSGKTLLAKALNSLLPPLTFPEAIEVAKIYSAVGLIKNEPLSFRRPFRSPHHTTSAVAIVGGGAWPKPGEISLAHRGVLFMDELPEFPRNVLESLRQPLEDGNISISRASGSIQLPAKFMLVAAMNPCPCGNFGDPKNNCICPPIQVIKYKKKISGPLLDRIDLQINVPRENISAEKVSNLLEIEGINKKIKSAREIQTERLGKFGVFTNSEVDYRHVDKVCNLDGSAERLLKQAINVRGLSLRSYHKIKKLARTVADLEQSEAVREQHVAEAIAFRVNEQMLSEV